MRRYEFDAAVRLPVDGLVRLAEKHGCRCVIRRSDDEQVVMFVAPVGFFSREKMADIGIGMNGLQLVPRRRATFEWYDGE